MIEIDNERGEVRIDGKETHFSPIEFKLLNALKIKDGKIASREELALVASPVAAKAKAYELRIIDQHIARIRRKLGPKRRSLIKTVSYRGYKLARA